MIPPMHQIYRQNMAQHGFRARSLFQTETIHTISAEGQAVPSKAACPNSTNRYPSPSSRVNFPRVGPRCSFGDRFGPNLAFTSATNRDDIGYQGISGAEPEPIKRQNRETNQCRNLQRSLAWPPFWRLALVAIRIWSVGLAARPWAQGPVLLSMAIFLPARFLAARLGCFATTLPTPANAPGLAPQYLHHQNDRPVLRAGRFAFEH